MLLVCRTAPPPGAVIMNAFMLFYLEMEKIMAYQINAGIWSSVFAVPTAIVDEHIKMCSPLSLKVLLLLLRHSGTAVDVQWLSEQLHIPPADISDALSYWIGVGIVSDGAQPAVSAPTDHTEPVPPVSLPPFVPEVRTEQTLAGQKLLTISARPKISREDIAVLVQSNSSIGQLLHEAQAVLGAPLTPVESEILTALCSYYDMQPEVVLMLLQYCVSTGQKSMSRVEKIAASWLERGISTHEQAEQEILRLTRDNEHEQKIKKAFGLYSRGLTPREREYIPQWYALGLEEPLLFLACERAAENTGKVSFAYADKILASWKAKGITTIKAAVEDLNSGGKPAPQNKSAQTGGESSLDMDKLSGLLHGQFHD